MDAQGLSGLGLLSLFVFGVTLEAVNNPKELSAILFVPWGFVAYGLTTLAIPLSLCVLLLPLADSDPAKAEVFGF